MLINYSCSNKMALGLLSFALYFQMVKRSLGFSMYHHFWNNWEKYLDFMTIYNKIRWFFAGLLWQMTHRPSIWCSKHYSFYKVLKIFELAWSYSLSLIFQFLCIFWNIKPLSGLFVIQIQIQAVWSVNPNIESVWCGG